MEGRRLVPGWPIYKVTGEFFKALAHPLRIRVLELLVEGDKTVSQLLAGTGAEPSHLSQQLGILRTAGIVSSRREGPNVSYAARDTRIFQLMATAKAILSSSLEETEELLADLQGLGFDKASREAPG